MKTKETKKKNSESTKAVNKSASLVLISTPRITEKATIQMEKNIYSFNVSPRATKPEIMKAIISLYKVTPLKINMVTIPSKNVVVRGKKGVKSGGKKALVFLKKEDKIEIA